MRWIDEVNNSVLNIYGQSRADAMRVHLSSMLWKIMLANYHAEESQTVLQQYSEGAQNEFYTGIKNIILSASGSEAAFNFNKSQFVSEAHTIAFAQSLHSTADILAQALYLGLDLENNLEKTLEEKKRNLYSLRDGMKKAQYALNIADAIASFLALEEFKYLHKYTNKTKHHSLLDFSYGVSLEQKQYGIRISAFEDWPRKWSVNFVIDDFEVIKNGLNQIGVETSRFLLSKG